MGAAVSERVLNVVKQMTLPEDSRGRFRSDSEFDKAVSVAQMLYKATSIDAPLPKGELADMITKATGLSLPGGGSGQVNQLSAALQQMNKNLLESGIDVGKEIDFDSFTDAIPTSLGFNVFDLSGPARITAPFMAPLRERIPRVSGIGPAGMFKIVTGFSGSMTGGVGSLNPAFNIEVPLAGSNVEAARGNPIEYATADGITQYMFHAIRDSVTIPAFLAGEGFQDLRAMSAALGMQMAMMAEERALLMGRSSALAAPGAATGTARAVAGAEVGIIGAAGAGTDVIVKVTAIGPFGETAGGTASAATTIAAAAVRVIDYTWTDVPYALGYNVYVSLNDNGGGAGAYYKDYIVGSQQSTGYNHFTVGTAGRRTSGDTAPATDTGTGSALNYRGLIQSIEEGPVLGTTSIVGSSQRYNAAQSGTALTWLQNILATMWQDSKADPEDVWMNSREIKNASALIIAGDTTNYRINMTTDNSNGITAGILVSSVINESTRRVLGLKTHPWLPFGNALILSYGLPFATAFGQTNAMEVKGPQDYMQIQWPLTTLRWEWSLLWYNALMLYAPTFQAVVHGIAQSDATSFIC